MQASIRLSYPTTFEYANDRVKPAHSRAELLAWENGCGVRVAGEARGSLMIRYQILYIPGHGGVAIPVDRGEGPLSVCTRATFWLPARFLDRPFSSRLL